MVCICYSLHMTFNFNIIVFILSISNENSTRSSFDVPDSRRSSEDAPAMALGIFQMTSSNTSATLVPNKDSSLVPVMSPISEFSCDFIDDMIQGLPTISVFIFIDNSS